MPITLQATMKIGDHTVAALVETSCFVQVESKPRSAWLSKRPVAILLNKEEQVSAFDHHGKAMTLNEVERLCPGALANFTDQSI